MRLTMRFVIVLGFLTELWVLVASEKPPPNIVFILADDLGWNDVGFHGSSQIPTPNLDALAYSGVILNRYYVTPICTPSRSALMTGKYPIHTGMQHAVLYGMEPRGLPLTEKLLPQYLKELGYMNHIYGKWHLGSYTRNHTPLKRGFDSHVGFWTGHHHMFDHTAVESGTWGLDMRRGFDVAYDLHGKYTTHVIRDESVAAIRNHNTSVPMFLYVSHAAVHSANPYDFLPAPDATVARMFRITNFQRRKFAAMLMELDQSVGTIMIALSERGMLDNSIIVFSTDNGGPADGFNNNAASNWPLRGTKNTLWEGGVRGAGFIWSPLIEERCRVSHQVMHISDWLPTLLDAAGYDLDNLPMDLDGISVWKQLQNGNQTDRTEILHNIDDIWGSAALTVDNWKVVHGTNYEGKWDAWYGPPGNRDTKSYNVKEIFSCPTGKALNKLRMLPPQEEILQLRREATVHCTNGTKTKCNPLEAPCLFDLENDPCELQNLADEYPEILQDLLGRLDEYNASAVPPGNMPLDPKGDPRFWGYTWHNFGDELPMKELSVSMDELEDVTEKGLPMEEQPKDGLEDVTERGLPMEELPDVTERGLPMDELDDVTERGLPMEELPMDELEDVTESELTKEELPDVTERGLPMDELEDVNERGLPMDELLAITERGPAMDELDDVTEAANNEMP